MDATVVTELQVSVEVQRSLRSGYSVWLAGVSGDDWVRLGNATTKDAANELADSWRVALRNIDGPEHATGEEWCITHQTGEVAAAWHRKVDHDCVWVPLFFRDIKDKGASE